MHELHILNAQISQLLEELLSLCCALALNIEQLTLAH
jgi:hypothetical protein